MKNSTKKVQELVALVEQYGGFVVTDNPNHEIHDCCAWAKCMRVTYGKKDPARRYFVTRAWATRRALHARKIAKI